MKAEVARRRARALTLTAFVTWAFAACLGAGAATPEVRLEPLVARAPVTGPLAVVAPLAGCWRGLFVDGRTEVEERWTPPEGDLMLGTTRYFRGGRAVDFEFALLRADSAGVVLLPHPRGRASPHPFRLTHHAADAWTFEAPDHDFPKRILYRLEGTQLEARIDGGPDDPEPRRWLLRSEPCAG